MEGARCHEPLRNIHPRELSHKVVCEGDERAYGFL
jgi:hypothetical protein